MLGDLSDVERDRLVAAMHTIQALLGSRSEQPAVPYILRPHQTGDVGWIVQRHGVLLREEYGWNDQYEAHVTETMARFLHGFDAARERCWMAERNGETVGSALLTQHPERADAAQLQLLLVEPGSHCLGIGRRLVQECTLFALHVGYGSITLWSASVLEAARAVWEGGIRADARRCRAPFRAAADR
jgi:GNAT superfamily N-acetyltransferase